MKSKKIMKSTINNSEYNKIRKIFLERNGQIKCSFCNYHNGENYNGKYYGTIGVWKWNIPNVGDRPYIKRVRYPNWKLVTKNKKQWMKKKMITKKKYYRFFEDYYSFEF